MNLLLVGASGFIGRAIYCRAKQLNINVVGTATNPVNKEWYKFDLKNDDICSVIEQSKLPLNDDTRAVITSFYTGNERTVTNLKEAERVDVYGMQKLLDVLHDKGIKTLWLSTEQVFCGRDGMAPYRETDATSPVLTYGRHKAEMECYIKENMPETVIYRLSQNIAPYVDGIHIFNDVYTRYQNGERHFKSIQGQIISPTDVRDTANWIIEGLRRNLPGGIYHFANPDSMPRCELVRKFLRAMGNDATVEEVPLHTFAFKESRPLDTRLCIDKILRVMPDITFTPVEEVIREFTEKIGGGGVTCKSLPNTPMCMPLFREHRKAAA